MADAGGIDEMNEKTAANAEKRHEISSKDLPLHCPMSGMTQWDSHPRVFLPIEQTGEVKCPYCGATYLLKDG